MELHVLEKGIQEGYTTWGCMWEQGTCRQSDSFLLKNSDGARQPVQSRITAFWPDGSVKWTAHTADSSLLTDTITVERCGAETGKDSACMKKQPVPETGIKSEWTGDTLSVHAGKTEVTIRKQTGRLFETVSYQGKVSLTHAQAILQLARPLPDSTGGLEAGQKQKEFHSRMDSIQIEDAGRLQTTVKFTGIHVAEDGEERFPFVIRMKIGYDNPEVGFTHTFLYDGDEDRDFLKGMGITFGQPLAGEIYNRHVKFQGDHGVFHESMANLCTWRPRVDGKVYTAQMHGEQLAVQGETKETVDRVLQDMPFWDTYTFTQTSASSFSLRKKMAAENCCYLDCMQGRRTNGAMAAGSEAGSLLCSIRDFWEKYPSGYTICGMTGQEAQITLWFWSPQAEPMDFRHYANRGYNQVYYEGYDYKGATPYGIACTSEAAVRICDRMIPEDAVLEQFSARIKNPVQYVAAPETYYKLGAFGYWSLPSEETEMEQWLEQQLSMAADFYLQEVDQRNWYGMFNYGDVMHTYDKDRHCWRYDMGGYAWDNTELVPTLWLWYYFLRTGRADVYHLAEHLSRHASEVDVYHMGKYKGMGSRHNVRHWGCPCKEARIAMAGHHRMYYFLTGDRRLEDIFEELKDNEMTFLNRDPLGDFFDKKDMVFPSHARSGPDWSSLCSNWMMQWERTGDTKYRDKILVGMQDIKNSPLKLVSGPDFEFDPKSVHLRYIGERATGGTHLQICMGAPEIWMEMADLLDDEEWKKMMAEYGRFYYLPRKEQEEESHGLIGDREFSLPFMAAGMAAYGASYLHDKVLAGRTWRFLLHAMIHEGDASGFETRTVPDAGNQKELKEIPWISTNFVAQWCLNVIVALRFVRKDLPQNLQEANELIADMNAGTFHKA